MIADPRSPAELRDAVLAAIYPSKEGEPMHRLSPENRDRVERVARLVEEESARRVALAALVDQALDECPMHPDLSCQPPGHLHLGSAIDSDEAALRAHLEGDHLMPSLARTGLAELAELHRREHPTNTPPWPVLVVPRPPRVALRWDGDDWTVAELIEAGIVDTGFVGHREALHMNEARSKGPDVGPPLDIRGSIERAKEIVAADPAGVSLMFDEAVDGEVTCSEQHPDHPEVLCVRHEGHETAGGDGSRSAAATHVGRDPDGRAVRQWRQVGDERKPWNAR